MTALNNETAWQRCMRQSLREAGWAPLLVFVVHLIALGGFDAYTLIASLDLYMHFIGGLVMAFFLHQTLINASRAGILGPHHPISHRLLIFTATCTIALFWEFAEFFLDQTLGTFSQADVEDTMTDLFFGMLGAGVFTLFSAVVARYARRALGAAVRKSHNIEALPGD